MTIRSQGKRSIAAALAALALGGCAQAQARMNTLLARAGLSDGADGSKEQLFSVLWWTKADETEGLPYKPVEPASPEYDAVSGNTFVATHDGKVHAFGPGGSWLWDAEVGGPFNAGPTFADNRLFVGNARGDLVALDPATGRQLWSYSAGESLMTRPVVAEGLVLVVSASDTLFAVTQEKGEWKWQYKREQPGVFSVYGAARPAVDDGKVLAGFADGYAVALDLADGGVLWARQLSNAQQFNDVDANPVVDDYGHVCFAAFSSGVFCLDATSGETVWTVAKPGITALALDADAGRLYAGGAGFVSAYASDSGQPRWSLSMGDERYVSGLTTVDGVLVTATGRGPLLFLDAGSGKLRRAFDPGHGVYAAPTRGARGDMLVLSNRGYIYSLALDTAVK